jgi:hypothetical protein
MDVRESVLILQLDRGCNATWLPIEPIWMVSFHRLIALMKCIISLSLESAF